jgi:hypothetical protein
MLSTSTAAVLGLLYLAAAGQTATVPPPDPASVRDLPVSLSRIRDALKKPVSPRLTLPPPRADFRVEVLEKQRFEDLLTLLGLGGGSPMPSVMFGSAVSHPSSAADLSAIGRAAGRAIVEARRARAERLAREEVQRALIDFCATHECPVR